MTDLNLRGYLVGPDVHPVRAVSESIGSGNQDEILMAHCLRASDAIGNRQMAVGERLIKDQKNVCVGGVNLV